MELYLERVRDLLNPSMKKTLKVREHRVTGPYVEDLSTHAVANFDMIRTLMDEGDKMRTVAATKMNDVSSRSHAIFQLRLTQTKTTADGVTAERVSKINLVDLAGSERSGQINKKKSSRLKEGNVINQSLSTLGKCMTALAERSSKPKQQQHIPYRESQLTWLLRESLGGNSKTLMMAAVSPASGNMEETLSTLRYANQAKKIVNAAVVNEDATAIMIRQLNEEIEELRSQLANAGPGGAISPTTVEDQVLHANLQEQREAALQKLQRSEKLYESLNETWEEKLAKTQDMQQQRLEQLRKMGILLADSGDGEAVAVGVLAPENTPYLLNLGAKAGQLIVYYLSLGTTLVTHLNSTAVATDVKPGTIELASKHVLHDHCIFTCKAEGGESLPATYLSSNNIEAHTTVNRVRLEGIVELGSGDEVVVGTNLFRYENPARPAARESAPSLSPQASVTGHSAASIMGTNARGKQPLRLSESELSETRGEPSNNPTWAPTASNDGGASSAAPGVPAQHPGADHEEDEDTVVTRLAMNEMELEQVQRIAAAEWGKEAAIRARIVAEKEEMEQMENMTEKYINAATNAEDAALRAAIAAEMDGDERAANPVHAAHPTHEATDDHARMQLAQALVVEREIGQIEREIMATDQARAATRSSAQMELAEAQQRIELAEIEKEAVIQAHTEHLVASEMEIEQARRAATAEWEKEAAIRARIAAEKEEAVLMEQITQQYISAATDAEEAALRAADAEQSRAAERADDGSAPLHTEATLGPGLAAAEGASAEKRSVGQARSSSVTIGDFVATCNRLSNSSKTVPLQATSPVAQSRSKTRISSLGAESPRRQHSSGVSAASGKRVSFAASDDIAVVSAASDGSVFGQLSESPEASIPGQIPGGVPPRGIQRSTDDLVLTEVCRPDKQSSTDSVRPGKTKSSGGKRRGSRVLPVLPPHKVSVVKANAAPRNPCGLAIARSDTSEHQNAALLGTPPAVTSIISPSAPVPVTTPDAAAHEEGRVLDGHRTARGNRQSISSATSIDSDAREVDFQSTRLTSIASASSLASDSPVIREDSMSSVGFPTLNPSTQPTAQPHAGSAPSLLVLSTADANLVPVDDELSPSSPQSPLPPPVDPAVHRERRTSQAYKELKCQLVAWLVLDTKHVPLYLIHLVINMTSTQYGFPLVPAYGLYNMIVSQAIQETPMLVSFQDLIGETFRKALHAACAQNQVNKLAMILANATELLMALRIDEDLLAESGTLQVELNDCIQDAYSAMLAMIKARLSPAYPRILREGSVQAGLGSTGAMRAGRHSFVGPGMTFLLDSLDSLHTLFYHTLMPKALTHLIFDSVYYHIGASTFNMLMNTQDNNFLTWSRGLVVQFNISQLTEWARERSLPVTHQLAQVAQSARLLQLNKSSIAHLDSLCDACPQLNSLQIERLLKKYKATDEEPEVAKALLDCMRARAMNSVDRYAEDEEAARCQLQIERDESHALPFRLTGPYHVDEGMYDLTNFAKARTSIEQISFANLGKETERQEQASRASVPAAKRSFWFGGKKKSKDKAPSLVDMATAEVWCGLDSSDT